MYIYSYIHTYIYIYIYIGDLRFIQAMLFSISTLNKKTVTLCPLGHKTPQAANITQGHNTQNKQHNLPLEASNDVEP